MFNALVNVAFVLVGLLYTYAVYTGYRNAATHQSITSQHKEIGTITLVSVIALVLFIEIGVTILGRSPRNPIFNWHVGLASTSLVLLLLIVVLKFNGLSKNDTIKRLHGLMAVTSYLCFVAAGILHFYMRSKPS